MCIIDHLSEFGVCGVNSNCHDGYHAPSVDEFQEPQQKAKWVAMNALGMLNIDTRTDEEKLRDAVKSAVNGQVMRRDAIVSRILKSSKFTITLNK